MTVKRNAYGRQLGSFHTEAEFKGIGEIPMTFIRAPYVADVSDGVEVLAVVQDRIVAVRYGKRWRWRFIRSWMRMNGCIGSFCGCVRGNKLV